MNVPQKLVLPGGRIISQLKNSSTLYNYHSGTSKVLTNPSILIVFSRPKRTLAVYNTYWFKLKVVKIWSSIPRNGYVAAGSGTPHGKCLYGVEIAELVVLHQKHIL